MAPSYPMVCRARVTQVLDDIGSVVKCEIPDLAPGVHWGPIESMVDGLAVDDFVLTAQVGFTRDTRVILGRTVGRRATTSEIVGLDDALGELVTRMEYADVTDRIDTLAALLDDRVVIDDDTVRALQRTRAELTGLRRRLADISDAMDAAQLERRGSLVAAHPPTCELRLDGDVNIPAGDILAQGGWSAFRDTEAEAGRPPMATESGVYRAVRIRSAGRYNIEFKFNVSNTQSNPTIGRILLNPNTAGTAAQQVVSSTVFSGAGFVAAQDGQHVLINQSETFAVDDVLTFGLYSPAATTIRAAHFVKSRSKLVVRYVGAR